MPIYSTDTIGLPGLAALGLGFVLFAIALMAARARAARAEKVANSGTASASWIWIVVQGIAIGFAGFGRINIGLDPLSAKAIIEAIVVMALMASAVGLFYASSRAMGKNWALVARTRSDHTLVQSGPFAWVRHPIYVALFLFMVAMAIAYGHSRNLVVAVPIYAIATWMRIRYEEQLLRAQFGPEYDAYASRVKRFVPGVF